MTPVMNILTQMLGKGSGKSGGLFPGLGTTPGNYSSGEFQKVLAFLLENGKNDPGMLNAGETLKSLLQMKKGEKTETLSPLFRFGQNTEFSTSGKSSDSDMNLEKNIQTLAKKLEKDILISSEPELPEKSAKKTGKAGKVDTNLFGLKVKPEKSSDVDKEPSLVPGKEEKYSVDSEKPKKQAVPEKTVFVSPLIVKERGTAEVAALKGEKQIAEPKRVPVQFASGNNKGTRRTGKIGAGHIQTSKPAAPISGNQAADSEDRSISVVKTDGKARVDEAVKESSMDRKVFGAALLRSEDKSPSVVKTDGKVRVDEAVKESSIDRKVFGAALPRSGKPTDSKVHSKLIVEQKNIISSKPPRAENYRNETRNPGGHISIKEPKYTAGSKTIIENSLNENETGKLMRTNPGSSVTEKEMQPEIQIKVEKKAGGVSNRPKSAGPGRQGLITPVSFNKETNSEEKVIRVIEVNRAKMEEFSGPVKEEGKMRQKNLMSKELEARVNASAKKILKADTGNINRSSPAITAAKETSYNTRDDSPIAEKGKINLKNPSTEVRHKSQAAPISKTAIEGSGVNNRITGQAVPREIPQKTNGLVSTGISREPVALFAGQEQMKAIPRESKVSITRRSSLKSSVMRAKVKPKNTVQFIRRQAQPELRNPVADVSSPQLKKEMGSLYMKQTDFAKLAAGNEDFTQLSRSEFQMTDTQITEPSINIRPRFSVNITRNGAPVRNFATPEFTPLKVSLDRLSEEITKLQLKIVPKNLGDVTIDIINERSNIHARFIVESAEVKQILLDALPQLKEAVSQHGLQLGDVLVATEQDEKANWSHDMSKSGNKGNGEKDQVPDNESGDEIDGQLPLGRQMTRTSPYSTVEYLA